MENVRILYVSGIPLIDEGSEERLHRYFETACGSPGGVERVKRLKTFAFVHFYKREDAQRALHQTGGAIVIGEKVCKLTWSKPPPSRTDGNSSVASSS